MKKKRILSALTSLAMIGTMVAGALPFSVSAATKDAETTMNLGLTTTAPTSYAEGTYENGLEIPVSVVVNNYDEAEMYTGLQCNVAGPEGVKIKSMSIPGNSADRKNPDFVGNWFSCVGGDGYSNRDFKCSVTPDTAYTPGFSLMSQSGLKPFTQNTYTKQGAAIANFVAVFDAGLKPGKYDIDFTFLAGVNSNDVNLTLKYVPTGEKLTIELGGDTEPTEETTEAPTEETTEAPTTEKPQVPTDKEFVGDVDLYFDQKEAAPGEEVEIGVKADTHGKSLLGIEFKYAWDNKLSLVPGSGVLGFGFDAGATVGEGTYVLGEQVAAPNDPDEYMVSFKFKVPSDAKPGDVYEIGASGTNGHVDPTFTITKKNGKYQQLTPVIKTIGKITIAGETEDTTEKPQVPTDKEFVGDADIYFDQKEAAPGEEVEIGVKVDTHGESLLGIEFKYAWDKELSLVPKSGQLGFGFDAGATVGEGTYILGEQYPAPNDPDEYMVSFKFKVPSDAKPGDVFEIGASGTNGHVDPTFTITKLNGKYQQLTPVIKQIGKITIVGETEESTEATKPTETKKTTVSSATETKKTTVSTKSTTKPVTDKPVTETSVSQVVVTETSISKVVVTETSVSKVVVTETSVSKVVVTETSVSKVVVTETSVSKVVVTETSVSKVVVTETSVSKVVVTETSVSKIIIPSTETEISKVIVTETSVSKVVVTETSVSKIIIPSTETEISKVIVTETSVSVVTVTSISIVVVTETSISSVVTTGTGDKPSTDISVDVSGVDPSADNGQWYHTDDQVFVKDGIKVLFDGKDITADAEIIFDETPASVYDSKTHAEDYTVSFTVKYKGAEATAEIPVKIGVRGDSKVNSEVDVFDAIRIAQYTVKRQQIVEGSFDAFRSDVNESGEIDVFDAVAIAKYTVSRDANPWVKIIKNYNNIITKEAK